MKAKAHRRISEAVARELWPDRDCHTLVVATATFDWPGTDVRHHPTEESNNLAQIMDFTHRARHEYLEEGFSQEWQCRLGDIFHLIQDGFISSDNMDTHNLIEGHVSRLLEQFPFYGIEAERLTTEVEVAAFLWLRVRPLQDAEEILESAFRACLSIGKATTSPRGRFRLGEQANHLVAQADRLLHKLEEQANQWQSETDKGLESYEEYFRQLVSDREAERERSRDAAKASVLRHIIRAVNREERRYQREIRDLEEREARWFGRSKAAKEAQLNRLLEHAAKVALTLRKLKDMLARGYQSRYEFMERNASWLGVDIRDVMVSRELESIIVEQEKRLCRVPLACGINARKLGVAVERNVLSELGSYPVFERELGPLVKAD